MAYTLGQRKNGPDLTASAAAPTPAQGSSASAPQNGATAPAPAASGPTLGQGGYVNFQNYLGLDSGAGQQMAGRVAGDVRQAGAQAKSQIGNDASAFGSAASAGVPTFTPIAPKTLSGPVQRPDTGEPTFENPKTGYQPPPLMTINPGTYNRQAYGKAAQQAQQAGQAATYSGPMDTNGAFDQSQQAVGNYTAKANSLTTPGGIASELGSLYGGPSTQGGLALDAALAGSAGGEQLRGATSGYGDLMGQLGLAETGANNQIAAAQQATQGVQNQYAQQAAQFAQMAKPPPTLQRPVPVVTTTLGPQGLPRTPPASAYPGKRHHG